ncbi:L-galactose dehydrogenase [Colletotrichum fioriniae PJ7]|uniref:L-galactose dehydrogenase n=1 Tax=Colletotrichum fioriniae PJ7 TaxID=1445577 RepID=A0A010RGC0_9PEZI|nr:L-galactose dehydrogenase [Colletotrichum fioriniae PJ7]
MATTTSLNPASRPSIASVLPPLFLGTATFNTQHVKDPLQMPYRQIVSRALELGVNGFDTSPYYGPSEVLLGDALAAHTAATNIPRESYVLVTKAGRIAGNEFDYSPAYVRYSVLRSLSRLNTTYLDLVYMHDVEFVSPAEVLAAVQTLRQLRDEGKIRYVGISGFPVHVLCSLAEMILAETGEALDAILSYGHFTIQNPTLGLAEVVAGPDHTDEQSPLRRFRNAGVQVVLNASMLGMGLLTSTGVPARTETAEGKAGVIASWHPAPDDLRSACQKLSTIASDAGERLETVALHWSMEEYARVGAAAGLGVQLPGQSGDVRVGGSVMGVTSTAELEQTVESWKLVLEGLAAGSEASARYEKLKALVEQKMWPELGVWKGYSWASPDEGFQNERSADKFGLIPEEDELMTSFMTRISSNFCQLAAQPALGTLRGILPAAFECLGNHKARSLRSQPDRIFAIFLLLSLRIAAVIDRPSAAVGRDTSRKMTEAFGLAASVFATIQIADRVVSICKHYIETVRDAPSDLRTIFVECSSVGAVLQNVEFLLKFEELDSALRKALDGVAGPVGECHGAIEKLEKLIASDQNQAQGPPNSKRRKVQVTLGNLAWPLKETKARKLLQDVARCKTTISLALTATSRHTDPSPIHHRACANHEPGTCDWMSRTPEWTQFSRGDIRCLWIHGIPGAGKTILASQSANKIVKICQEYTLSGSVSIGVYYYCYFGRDQDESTPFVRWILERICREVKEVPDDLWKVFDNGGEPSLAELLAALESALRFSDSVFIVIDAVDESSPREELLRVLRDLATDPRFAKIRLLVTSREYLDIENVMREVSTAVSMRNDYLDDDIRLYTKSRLSANSKLKDWPEDLRNETLKALTCGAKGMFRWVVCQLDALRRIKESKKAIMNALRNLPKTLDEAYDRIFNMIPGEDLQIVCATLDWICFNYKVFQHEHLSCNVLLDAIKEDLTRSNPRMQDYRYDADLLRELCGCLITVRTDDETFPDGELIVSFPHYTVMEYLAASSRFDRHYCFSLDVYNTLGGRAGNLLSQAFLAEIDDPGIDPLWPLVIPWQMDFRIYCAFSAMKLISEWDKFFITNEELAALLITPHPSRIHPVDVMRQLHKNYDEDGTINLLVSRFGLDGTFWYVQHRQQSSPRIRILVDLLHIGAYNLVDFILNGHDANDVLRCTVDVDYMAPSSNFGTPSHYQVPLCDFIAMTSGNGVSALRYLLASWPETFDSRTTLLHFVMWHNHDHACIDYDENSGDAWCTLQKMLHLGAEADSLEFVVTPLQIAVACLDIEGVKILLKSGADPTARGNQAGIIPSEYAANFGLDHLSGMTPLQICEPGFQESCATKVFSDNDSFESVLAFRVSHLEDISGQIQDLLREYGAA